MEPRTQKLPTPRMSWELGVGSCKLTVALPAEERIDEQVDVTLGAGARLAHARRRTVVRPDVGERGPRLRQHLRIIHREVVEEHVALAKEPLGHLHLVRVEIALPAEPRFVAEADRLD